MASEFLYRSNNTKPLSTSANFSCSFIIYTLCNNSTVTKRNEIELPPSSASSSSYNIL